MRLFENEEKSFKNRQFPNRRSFAVEQRGTSTMTRIAAQIRAVPLFDGGVEGAHLVMDDLA